jgi:hypothetical protein
MNSEPEVRADLHVHSIHSERPSEWILKTLGTRESYTQPEHIYRLARKRGMDLVVSDAGGPQEIILEGQTGLVAREGDLQDWQRRVQALLDLAEVDPPAYRQMRERAVQCGFGVGVKTLVVAEGVFQYLKPEAAIDALRTVRDLVGTESWLVFDYAHFSALRGAGESYGEARMVRGVRRIGESWQFGLEEAEVGPLLRKYSFRLVDRQSPRALEDMYFRSESGRVISRINGTQSIALAERL